ncbi:MAG TPA: alpha/beta hydrolase [Cryomorphaceae bacterium]|nr:alpha/beta hydrolase [Cryomorphaceae bacterium]
MEWGNEGPRVLLVHGWSGRGTQFFKLIEELLEKKFHVFAINAPAHGDSKQKKTHLFEFVDAIEIMVSQFAQFSLAIGHSLGGMAIFNALERNLSAEKIVIIGSPANIQNVVLDFCDRLQVSHKIGHRIIERIEKNYHMSSEEASTDFLANKYNPPGLIIHDVDDLDIDINNAYDLQERWPNANLVVTEGKGHRKILMDIKVIDTIVGFLQ